MGTMSPCEEMFLWKREEVRAIFESDWEITMIVFQEYFVEQTTTIGTVIYSYRVYQQYGCNLNSLRVIHS
jgi:hypothetical protein